MRIVIETNVVVSALRSRTGAAFTLVSMIPSYRFITALSNPLYHEYLDVVFRPDVRPPNAADSDLLNFIDHILDHSETQRISYLWRPFLRDPNDDMLLELAVAAQAEFIVTYNVKDFVNIELFGIEAILPGDFLNVLKSL